MSDKEVPAVDPLNDDEQRVVVDQFEGLRERSQRSFDESLRAIAAGGVAVTASLAAAFKESGWSGTLAVAFALLSLFANLLSFWTPQRDADYTIDKAWQRDRVAVFNSRWRKVTGYLNLIAFGSLVASGVCLLVFVSSVV